MDAAFFPSLSYGEAALEDILQLFGDDENVFAFPSPDTVDSPQDLETVLCPAFIRILPMLSG
jgi:hypothetical protein